MSIVIDEAWTKASASQLHSWGAIAAGMYLSHDPSKNANPAIVNSYAAAGIKSFLFFEDTANRALGGYPSGVADARFSLTLAGPLHMPTWAPFLPTADFDIPDYAPNSNDPKAKLGPIGDYWKGWCDTVGANRTFCYGSYYLCSRLIAAGLASGGVQTVAWSGGQVTTDHIACLQNGQMLDGGQVDVEVINSMKMLNLMAWVPGGANPSAPPPPPPATFVAKWSMWPLSTTLMLGQTSDAVGVLQTACRNSGYRGVRGITVDRVFGSQTLTAVKNFQEIKGLNVDGIAGQRTRNALVSLGDL